MTGSEQDENLDFNALVARLAGSEDGKESYLASVIMKVMTKQYGKGAIIPDSLGLPEIEAFAKKDVHTAWMLLDVIYSYVSKSLLGNSCHMHDIRSEAIKYMLAELERRQKIKREAGI